MAVSSILAQLLRRPPGTGWLILSGGQSTDAHIQRVLAIVDHAGPVAGLVPAPEFLAAAEEALDPWLVFSGRSGRAVECGAGDLEDALAEAALIVLPDGAPPQKFVEALTQSDAGEFLLAALDGGAVVVADGTAAEALGEAIVESGVELDVESGLGWIPSAVIQSCFTPGVPLPDPLKRKNLFRIGLPAGAAMAFGPGEEREIWGEDKPVITFPPGWVK